MCRNLWQEPCKKGKGKCKGPEVQDSLCKEEPGWLERGKRESISEQPESKGHAENSASSSV